MKKTIHLLLFIVLLLAAPEAMAQVVSICAGQDSVCLRLENYQYGKIQWMSSYDNENWELIEGANDTVYEFMPEEDKYYRAQVFFNDCEPVFSATSYVQTFPKPFAGTDKTLSTGSGIYLSASTQPGSIGQWDILSGIGGVLANDTSAYSFFYGSDTTYLLRWTMTNACGSRSDTLKIRYVETVYYPDIVYVDSTDQVLSDSAEMVNGIYRIIFSDSSVVVSDSSVLIGIFTRGFFEKVEHAQTVGDTFILRTHPATLDDILVYGVLNATEVHYIDTVQHAPMPYILLDHLPSRAEMQIPEIKNGHFRIVKERVRDDLEPYAIDYNRTISFNVANIISANGGLHISFIPNIQSECVKDQDDKNIVYQKFGLENARLHSGFELSVNLGGEKQFPLVEWDSPLLSFLLTAHHTIFMSFAGQCEGVNVSLSAGICFSAGFEYTPETGTKPFGNFSYEGITISANSAFHNNIEYIEAGLGYSISPRILGFINIGPYLDLSVPYQTKWCFSNDLGKKQASRQLYFKVKFGCKVSSRWKWLPISFDKYWSLTYPMWQEVYPAYVEAITQRNMFLPEDPNIPLTVSVRLFNSKRKPISEYGVPVHFSIDENCGIVFPETVFTDDNGIATTYWKPSTSNNTIQTLKAEVFGCLSSNSSHLVGSPMFFTARNKCLADGFRLSTNLSQWGNLIRICPQLENTSYSLGSYSFSTDGIHYYSNSDHTCVTNPAYDEPITFYAKNKDGCVVTYTDILSSPDCDHSNLSLNYTVEDYSVKVIPLGGQSPYSYCLDNSGFIESNDGSHTYSDLTPGEHLFEVRDSRGCVKSKTIVIGMPITVSFNPNCTDYSGVMLNQSIYANVATSLNPNTFSRDGYTFIGWNTQSDGSGTQYEDMGTVTLTQDITLYAQWGNDVNRITFHANGGVGTMNPFFAQHGTTITLPPATYTHPCLDFREWNTMMDGTGVTYPNMGTVVLNYDMDLYAQWDSAVSGTVYFHPNGAPDCDTHQQVFHKCASSALAPCTCHYHAFVFMGWNTEQNGGGTLYQDQEVVLPVGDLHLYAQWRPANVCNVFFDANGGTGNIDSISGFEAETVQLPSATPTKSGYHFLFWNTAADGSGTSYYPNSMMYLSQTVTLFAQWERNYYTVTFHANGGTGTMNPQHIYEDSLTALSPNTFTRSDNYTFSHWSTNETGSGTQYQDQQQVLLTSDLALYAQWITAPNTVSCQVSSYHSNETVVNGRLTSVSDHEGNVYPVVQMNGNSCWLRTNMRATTSPTTGASLTVLPGNLYTWYAATDSGSVRGICPYGWHVPLGSEWQSGISSIGAPVYFCGSGWDASSTPDSPGDYSNESRNISNFSLLPPGKYFINDGVITGVGTEAMLWLNDDPLGGTYGHYVKYTHQSVYPSYGYASSSCYYASLRCVRD